MESPLFGSWLWQIREPDRVTEKIRRALRLALEGAGGIIERVAISGWAGLLKVRQPRLGVRGPGRIVAHASQTGFRGPVRK